MSSKSFVCLLYKNILSSLIITIFCSILSFSYVSWFQIGHFYLTPLRIISSCWSIIFIIIFAFFIRDVIATVGPIFISILTSFFSSKASDAFFLKSWINFATLKCYHKQKNDWNGNNDTDHNILINFILLKSIAFFCIWRFDQVYSLTIISSSRFIFFLKAAPCSTFVMIRTNTTLKCNISCLRILIRIKTGRVRINFPIQSRWLTSNTIQYRNLWLVHPIGSLQLPSFLLAHHIFFSFVTLGFFVIIVVICVESIGRWNNVMMILYSF